MPEKQEESQNKTKVKGEVVSMRQLLECGVHFGHQTKRWDPRMKPYIFTSRNGIHVIDLQQSQKLIKDAYQFVKNIVEDCGSLLFVGTKKQAQAAIESEADRCKMPYVNHRWLGGLLTNNATIRGSINKLKEYERKKENGSFDKISNKELSRLTKAYVKLDYQLSGIKDMVKMPAAIFIVDTKREHLAIREARRLNIPIIGVVDTNADPLEVDFPIPANDDAIRSIKLLCSIMANAVNDGTALQVRSDEEQDKDEVTKAAEQQVLAAEKKGDSTVDVIAISDEPTSVEAALDSLESATRNMVKASETSPAATEEAPKKAVAKAKKATPKKEPATKKAAKQETKATEADASTVEKKTAKTPKAAAKKTTKKTAATKTAAKKQENSNAASPAKETDKTQDAEKKEG